jgi:two-component system nitrogen regulation sensor histidine kinase GlnL
VNLWRDIFDSLSESVIVLSTALEPMAVNPAAESLFGVPQANAALMKELMGRNSWLETMIGTCLKSGQDLSQAETTLALRGREVSVSAKVSPLLTRDGRLEGAVILLHDLSHQKGIHQAGGGEGSEAGLGLSSAGLAHEIKNPLTGIKGAAELLANLHPSDHRAQQYCDVIRGGVDRLAALVEEVLAVSGPQRLKQEPVNIHKVLHQAMAMAGLYPVAPPGIAIEQYFDPSLPDVSGDTAALERVFLNLIKNAVEAIDYKGIIRLRTRMETHFRVASGGVRRRFLRVEVSDSGKGMTPDEMAQLFTPFYTTKPNGTGLGLVLSQRIIGLHGGKIWAERGTLELSASANSEENDSTDFRPGIDEKARPAATRQEGAEAQNVGQGTTFKVILPIAAEASGERR